MSTERKDVWASGDAYEPYVGRWSRLVGRQFVMWLGVPPNVVKSCYGPAWHRVEDDGVTLTPVYHVLEIDRELLQGVVLIYARALSDGNASAGLKDWDALDLDAKKKVIEEALGRSVSNPTLLRVRAFVRRAIMSAMETT